MKMSILESSAKKLLTELDEKLERKQAKNSLRVKDWLWQKYRLEWILGALANRPDPVSDIKKAGFDRFSAFVVICGVDLKEDKLDMIRAAGHELEALGYEQISMSARSVLDPAPICGKDFA